MREVYKVLSLKNITQKQKLLSLRKIILHNKNYKIHKLNRNSLCNIDKLTL